MAKLKGSDDQARAEWLHALGQAVSRCLSAAITHLHNAGEDELERPLWAVKIEWERAIRRRCDMLLGVEPSWRKRADYHAAVQALRDAYAVRTTPALHVVQAKRSLERMRDEAACG